MTVPCVFCHLLRIVCHMCTKYPTSNYTIYFRRAILSTARIWSLKTDICGFRSNEYSNSTHFTSSACFSRRCRMAKSCDSTRSHFIHVTNTRRIHSDIPIHISSLARRSQDIAQKSCLHRPNGKIQKEAGNRSKRENVRREEITFVTRVISILFTTSESIWVSLR